tara:strand:+ start:1784 stop:2617 length:834 start_codon:yes stop_codon:yes gene_type:complete
MAQPSIINAGMAADDNTTFYVQNRTGSSGTTGSISNIRIPAEANTMICFAAIESNQIGDPRITDINVAGLTEVGIVSNHGWALQANQNANPGNWQYMLAHIYDVRSLGTTTKNVDFVMNASNDKDVLLGAVFTDGYVLTHEAHTRTISTSVVYNPMTIPDPSNCTLLNIHVNESLTTGGPSAVGTTSLDVHYAGSDPSGGDVTTEISGLVASQKTFVEDLGTQFGKTTMLNKKMGVVEIDYTGSNNRGTLQFILHNRIEPMQGIGDDRKIISHNIIN